jgi:translocation and assembly module TamB
LLSLLGRSLGGLLALATLAAAAAVAGLWAWSGHSDSVGDALQLAQRLVPQLHGLQWQQANGSLRDGTARLESLQWAEPHLTVRASGVSLRWSWPALWQGRLEFATVEAAAITVHDQRPPKPATPPENLTLPWPVQASVAVQTLTWSGAVNLIATELAGLYVYDGQSHRLQGARARVAAGRYTGDASLSARQPWAVSVQAAGTVSVAVAGRSQDLPLHARAHLNGPLGGPNPQLALAAHLQPLGRSAAAQHATVTATVRPWADQPIAAARVQARALDLANLWPGLPATLLDGEARIQPDKSGWAADLSLSNRLSGPWDQQRLPFEQIAAKGHLAGHGRWELHSGIAQGAGGRIWLDEARWNTTAGQPFGGTATVRIERVDPARVHTSLPATMLDGQLRAGLAGGTLTVAGDLRTSIGARAVPGAVALQRAQWQAVRRGPLWEVRQLDVQTADATLQASGQIDWPARTVAGALRATWPGAVIETQGHLAATAGTGTLNLQVTDALRAGQWLQRWPAVARALGGQHTGGRLTLQAKWLGGWQNQGRDLQIDARLAAPLLTLTRDGGTAPWLVRDLSMHVQGSPSGFAVTGQGRGEGDGLSVRLHGSATAAVTATGDWRGRLESAVLERQDSGPLGTVSARLAAPVPVDWQAGSATLAVGAGQVFVAGPGAQPGRLRWTELLWRGSTGQWQGNGRVEGLPLSWIDGIDALDGRTAGLRGDLELAGDWSVRVAPGQLAIQAELARSRGDLLVATEADDSGSTIAAGIRQARLTLTVNNSRASAQLRWDSERAGEATATVSTELSYQPAAGWQWPSRAPLNGQAQVRLPRLGVWAVLAPPGWRVRGTLDAQAVLTGTRAAPAWQGYLHADDLAVRSAAEGIEFSQGQLRASLADNRVDITSLSFRGAGSRGGQLDLTGRALWLPRPADQASTLPLGTRIEVHLAARAQALRVSARADRRLAVSGQLQASLDSNRLALSGSLRADQALFVLPEDDAPALGADVRVRGRGDPVNPAGGLAATAAPPPRRVPLAVVVDVTLDPGADFRVEGKGLTTRLAGSLRLRNEPGPRLQPQLTGELRTVAGSYRAYGQVLEITTGRLRFSGAWDNPALDILAVRPNLEQKVGVQIRGNAQAPLVRLWAEPDMPDPDKLAWLVLGRGAAQGGTESAVLQQAALALLGSKGAGLPGSVAQAFGLDEFSVRGASQTNLADLSGATVTVGKRLSRNFYVSYERSLTGALGTLFIFYDLSRRLTLRAQTGEQSAVDLVWTVPFD